MFHVTQVPLVLLAHGSRKGSLTWIASTAAGRAPSIFRENKDKKARSFLALFVKSTVERRMLSIAEELSTLKLQKIIPIAGDPKSRFMASQVVSPLPCC